MVLEPEGVKVEWRTDVEDMSVTAFLQVGKTGVGYKIGSSCVNLIHEVILLNRSIGRISERNSTRIINQDVDATKLVNSSFDSCLNSGLISDVNHAGETVASRILHFFGSTVNCAG
uniref:Uncharacterized protein n=1 Tax=Cacopsylla melanoneura TaxID=428564 RepID=A0A8D8TAP9_9HEMI